MLFIRRKHITKAKIHMCFIIVGSCRKYNFCGDITFVAIGIFCCDKSMLVSRQNKYLLGQRFCHNKIMFVVTKVLSRQAYFCCDKRCVLSWQTCVCHDKTFVTTKMILVAAPTSDRSQGWGWRGYHQTTTPQTDNWPVKIKGLYVTWSKQPQPIKGLYAKWTATANQRAVCNLN